MCSKEIMPLAFSSSKPRFRRPVHHPNLDLQGLYVAKPLGCDPALYRPQTMKDAYEKLRRSKMSKDPWRCKSELEDWCQNLGYKNQNILERRRWFATLLGPAWTIVPPPSKYEPACKNTLFGRTSRFKRSKDFVPGPGTYFRGKPYKVPYGPHSVRQTFDREEPCRFPDRTPRWELAPNRYKPVDPDSIENKSKKVVSLRGPYELFTGKRDGSTIKNHFGLKEKVHAKTWPLKLPGCLEGLKKKHTGVWNKTNREKPPRFRIAMTDLVMVPRSASEPSAASYNLRTNYEFPQNKYGFNSSYDQPPGYMKQIVWPGVGRYNVSFDNPCGPPGHGHRHVFISKIGRTIGAVIQEPMNSF